MTRAALSQSTRLTLPASQVSRTRKPLSTHRAQADLQCFVGPEARRLRARSPLSAPTLAQIPDFDGRTANTGKPAPTSKSP